MLSISSVEKKVDDTGVAYQGYVGGGHGGGRVGNQMNLHGAFFVHFAINSNVYLFPAGQR